MTAAARILVIQDDAESAAGVVAFLRAAGHEAHAVTDPRAAMATAERVRPELVVLDGEMPFVDGFTICRGLRERMGVAIVLLCEKDDPHDRTLALRLGADDCLAKPVDLNELEARIAALLWRYRHPRQEAMLRAGPVTVDLRGARASVDGEWIELTPTEFRLLSLLVGSPGRVFTRDELLREVWGGRLREPTRVVDVHLGRLRRKLEQHGVRGFLRARRGFGYSAPAASASGHALPPPLVAAA